MSLPTIAITMGDAAGIGPEVIMKRSRGSRRAPSAVRS
jgi:4-hydroxy-L-threonine phosphate dehydrogenase PdxA